MPRPWSLTRGLRYFATRVLQVAGMGFELPQENTEKTGVADESGAESGALDAENGPKDPDLGAIIDAWPRLPDAIKTGILAIIQGAEGQHHA